MNRTILPLFCAVLSLTSLNVFSDDDVVSTPVKSLKEMGAFNRPLKVESIRFKGQWTGTAGFLELDCGAGTFAKSYLGGDAIDLSDSTGWHLTQMDIRHVSECAGSGDVYQVDFKRTEKDGIKLVAYAQRDGVPVDHIAYRVTCSQMTIYRRMFHHLQSPFIHGIAKCTLSTDSDGLFLDSGESVGELVLRY